MSAAVKQPWTEGPLEVDEENGGGGLNLRAVVTEGEGGVAVAWTTRVVVGGVEVVSDAEAKANARLYSKASAMAEALALFIRTLDASRQPTTNPLQTAIDRDRAEKAARAVLDAAGWRWS